MTKPLACFIDFDGTIVTEDVSEKILEKFAAGDWKKYEEEAIDGKYTLEEVMINQYQLIRGEMDDIMDLALSFPVRDGFTAFLEEIREKNVEPVILSAGLSFVIKAFNEQYHWDLSFISADAILTPNGIELTFPNYDNSKALDYKQYAILKAQKDGFRVAYIGDGSSDFSAIKLADYRFVLHGSSLAEFCRSQKLEYNEFTSFNDITPHLSQI